MVDEGRLKILTDGAKYDVSCSSSGSKRKNTPDGIGNASFGGICHSFAQDGRCISLLKILMSNDCVFDCRYCPNRRSADVPRATVTPEEVCELTMDFYRRNYIEGLFLSSAVYKNPDYSMELLLRTAKLLRKEYKFNGYIHIKGIPYADKRLIDETAKLADRMSYNIELPAEESLKLLAPQKTKQSILTPMNLLANGKKEFSFEHKKRSGFNERKGTGKYLPAGQTTQMIVGATPETDGQILRLSQAMYRKFDLKRVYYSSYLPVVNDPILPNETTGLLREHRLYQADWLMRFYGFSSEEISPLNENLPMEYDPKCAWALRNMQFFPIEVNKASVEELLRVPGIGAKGAYKIISARKSCSLNFEHLKKMRIVLKRAKHFITASGKFYGEKKQENVKFHLMLAERQENRKQLDFFALLPSKTEEKNQILLSATQRDKDFLLNSSPQIATSVLNGQL